MAAAIESAKFLRSMGDVGQVNLIKVNVANYDQMARLIEGADHVISLVGILHETKGNTFETVQAKGPMLVGKIAREKMYDLWCMCPQLVQM